MGVEHGVQDVDRRRAVDRGPSAEHLEQDGAHREQVRARVDRQTARLLRRHVARRAEHDARQRESGFVERGRDGARQPEVEQLDAVRRQEDVGRFQIAVQHATAVQRVEHAQHRQRDGGPIRERHRAAREAIGE